LSWLLLGWLNNFPVPFRHLIAHANVDKWPNIKFLQQPGSSLFSLSTLQSSHWTFSMHLANKRKFLFVWNVCQLVAKDCERGKSIVLWDFLGKWWVCCLTSCCYCHNGFRCCYVNFCWTSAKLINAVKGAGHKKMDGNYKKIKMQWN